MPYGLQLLSNLVCTALAPTLLVKAPLLLVALSPLLRHLLLTSSSVPTVPFVVTGMISMLVVDPFMYLVGRDYGREALDWLYLRMGKGARSLKKIERWFQKAGPWVVFALPTNSFVCALAGVERMRLRRFIGANLAGTLTTLLTIRYFGEQLKEPIDRLLAFIGTYRVHFTIGAIVVVLLMSLGNRDEGEPPPKGEDERPESPG